MTWYLVFCLMTVSFLAGYAVKWWEDAPLRWSRKEYEEFVANVRRYEQVMAELRNRAKENDGEPEDV